MKRKKTLLGDLTFRQLVLVKSCITRVTVVAADDISPCLFHLLPMWDRRITSRRETFLFAWDMIHLMTRVHLYSYFLSIHSSIVFGWWYGPKSNPCYLGAVWSVLCVGNGIIVASWISRHIPYHCFFELSAFEGLTRVKNSMFFLSTIWCWFSPYP